MCLYSKQILPRRATKDIIVYKEMKNISFNIYESPVYPFSLAIPRHLGKIIHPCGMIKTSHSKRTWGVYKHANTLVEGGYFHSYLTFPLTLNYRILSNYPILLGKQGILPVGRYKWDETSKTFFYRSNIRILKCTIPKGALYWIGLNNDICSDGLIFNYVLSDSEITKILLNEKNNPINRVVAELF